MTNTSDHQNLYKILVIDDLPENLRLIEKILSKEGYKIQLAANGELALMSVTKFMPDLILLDIMMPDMDGYEVCKKLKSNPNTRDIPVIFLSAINEGKDKAKAFQIGGCDYITKPFQPEEALARVKHQINLRCLQDELKQRHQELLETNRQLQEAMEKLERIAHLDGLTKIPNRRYFDQVLNKEWRRMQRQQLPISMIFCDVDYFKLFNDSYGHLQGDDCLIQVAGAINLAIRRPGDVLARYGGEEFAVILPNTPTHGASTVAKKIAIQVNRLKIPHSESEVSDFLTLSMGVATVIPNSEILPESLIIASDYALYEAKKQGRNQIFVVDC